MSSFKRLFLVVVCCFVFTTGSHAGNELILKVKLLDEIVVKSIQHHFHRLSGVVFLGYHVESSCLLITYDSNKIQENELIFNIAALLDHTTHVAPVKGYKIFDILDGRYIASQETD